MRATLSAGDASPRRAFGPSIGRFVGSCCPRYPGGMVMTQLPRLLASIALPWTLLLALAGPLPFQAKDWYSGGPSPVLGDVQAAHARAEVALAATTPGDGPDSPEARLRTSLERRLSLLQELEALLARRVELAERKASLPGRVDALQAELVELEGSDVPAPPAAPTSEGFARLEAELDLLRSEVAAAQSSLEGAMRRQDKSADLRAAASQRVSDAEARRADLQGRVDATPAGTARELVLLQAANAGIDATVGTTQLELLVSELEGDEVLGDYRNVALNLAELKLGRKDRELELYGQALRLALDRERSKTEAELAAKASQADQAADPYERFVASWELEISRSRASLADAEPFRVDVSSEVREQEQRLANDRHELERLKADVEQSGTGGAVGAAIRRLFTQLRQRRKVVELAFKPRFEDRATALADRRFEVDQMLYGLSERWTDELAAALPEQADQDPARTQRARALRDELREALQAERSALTGAINSLRELRDVQAQRRRELAELESFIHAKVFWIQDREPLWDPSVWSALPQELELISGAVARPLAGDWSGWLGAKRLGDLAPVGLACLILPFVAVLARRRIRRLCTIREGAPNKALARAAGLFVLRLLHCLLLPGVFVALGAVVRTAELPEATESTLVRSLHVLALFFLTSSVSQTYLAGGGEAAQRGRSVLRFVGLGLLFLGLPWSLTSSGLFEVELLPRLLLVAFLILVSFGTWVSFSGDSPAARFVLGNGEGSRMARAATLWSAFLALALVALPLLEISGRRFASNALGWSLGKTLVTILVLAAVFRTVGGLIERALSTKRRKRGARAAENGEDDPRSQRKRAEQIRGFLRALCVLVGIWAVVGYWGLNDQVLAALRGWKLYKAGVDPVDGSQVWVVAADVVYSIVVLLATVWFLRHLPGIYELTVFPRFKLDRGLRYAIVTISRYGLFFLGAMISLQALRIDFSSLGWLVAAMGVGLGFGLQEIVSNFVSGIILLVERPIRVGDLVTVGDVIGSIQRINIRATTVLNLERQEVIVPNRSLIAQNVTNWTLASKILRLTIPIGVAYGSDVDRVKQLLDETARAVPDVLEDPAPQVFFMTHGESSLDYEVRVFINDANMRFVVTDRVNRDINKALAENGIEIPFPQRDLHLRSATPVQFEAQPL